MNYTILFNSNGIPAGFVQDDAGEYTEQQAKDAILCGKLNPTPQEIEQATVANDNQVLLDKCKGQAVILLQETDWTTIPDVANPSDSNPYLTNQREFMTWRSEIRQLAVNPVANPVWPTQPTPQWGNKA